MLIEFTVGNFKSFKNPVTLSMVASKEKSRNQEINRNNTFEINDRLRLITSASIYGANASGKSNLIKAFQFMRNFVIASSKETQVGESIMVDPFRLNLDTENEPSFFEAIFIFQNTQYRYGFEVSKERIHSEWLFSVPSTKEASLFIRNEGKINVYPRFKEGKDLTKKTRDNALFLSVVAQFNGQIAKNILNWFRKTAIISDSNSLPYESFTIDQFEHGNLQSEIIKLVKEMDLGIENIFLEKISKSELSLPDNMPEEIKGIIKNSSSDLISIKTLHKKWDHDKPSLTAKFDIDEESAGTQKIFFLTGPIFDVLHNGRILFIDELEAHLHPIMTHTIINMFNSNTINKNHAQLVFTTHDTNLLSKEIFRRDQIWFLEKDRQECSHLYSLVELKVRNDEAFEKNYIKGRYGAIPFIGEIKQIIWNSEDA